MSDLLFQRSKRHGNYFIDTCRNKHFYIPVINKFYVGFNAIVKTCISCITSNYINSHSEHIYYKFLIVQRLLFFEILNISFSLSA